MKRLLLTICLVALAMQTAAAQTPRPARATTWATAKPKSCPRVGGDLLLNYATKPAGLTLLGYKAGQPGGQTIAVATYQVAGADAGKVEAFFRAHYGMGELTFLCCGWEPAEGKQGEVESAALRKLNPDYSLLLTMYSDAQSMGEALASGDSGAWKDKRRVKRFLVEVKVMEI